MKKLFLFALSILVILIFNCYLFSENSGFFSLGKAINITLKRNNNILLKKESVKSREGEVFVSKSKFDTVINATASYLHSETPVTETFQSQTNSVSGGINVSKTFRTGITGGLSLSATRIEDITSSTEPTNQTTINFSLNIPLLEGFGIEHAASEELSARSKLKATKYSFLNTISQEIYRTSIYYWKYLYAVKNLKEYRQSLLRTEKLLKQVKILISKDAIPEADSEQILASLANKKANVYNAEQNVIYYKNNLITVLGLDPKDFEIVSVPSTDFPQINSEEISKILENTNKLLFVSLERRYDYLASKQSEKTAEIKLIGAIDKLKSNLDFSIQASYKRLESEKYGGAVLDSFWKTKPGFNINFLLNYQWPVENSYAKGLVKTYQSILKQNILKSKQLKRTIYLNIRTAVSDLEKSFKNLRESKESVKYYNRAVANEKKKYRLGMSTIIDVINLEDRLTSANLSEISANYKLASALAKLKYETGELINVGGDNNYKFNIKNVLTLFK